MEHKISGNVHILRLDKGEEIVETLRKYCVDNEITLGIVQGIGATNTAVIGLYDTEDKEYYQKQFTGDMEIAPLSGNVSTMDGEVYLHLHVNLGDKDNKAWAGHLNKAIVSATFECFITELEGTIDREKDEEIGLNLMKFE
jgi:predicted DNA-binding protein with PD1-like motif